MENRFAAIAEKLGYQSIDDLEEYAYSNDSNKTTLNATKKIHLVGSSPAQEACCSPLGKIGRDRCDCTEKNCMHRKLDQKMVLNEA